MPSQHKHSPVSLRLPEAERAWLLTYATQADRAVNAILVEALAEYRQRHEPSTEPAHDSGHPAAG